MHRLDIEQAFRFGKSELAMESPGLCFWENRLKLLAIVTLVYDFLLRMLRHWEAWGGVFLETGAIEQEIGIEMLRYRFTAYDKLSRIASFSVSLKIRDDSCIGEAGNFESCLKKEILYIQNIIME